MDKTKIQWTDATWNPTIGCSRVSAGCENCYAERVAWRQNQGAYEGLVRWVNGHPVWTGELAVRDHVMLQPIRWRRPRRIFVNSMSDLFHERLPFHTIAAIFGVMCAAKHHQFQVLTKRPARAAEFFAWLASVNGGPAQVSARLECAACLLAWEVDHHPDGDAGPVHRKHCPNMDGPWPLPNVWIGVSVEDQDTADERIPLLLDLPAAVRFVSYEPALGPVEWRPLLVPPHHANVSDDFGDDPRDERALNAIVRAGARKAGAGLVDWIIVGGESGPGARPFDVKWARDTINACRAASVACFVKQMGSDPRIGALPPADPSQGLELYLRDRKGGDWTEWPDSLRVREYPK